MTPLELALVQELVAAEFWQHQGHPERIGWIAIQHLSYRLHYRAAHGRARTIRKPSKLNSP
ncbi:hypothetical protein [Hymenobacter sediminis]|uniref:hypothetical protein n=1 Tax=Hymenobacter sediminis TaxID=2218621 RepID=UPI000DA68BA8|nr:hypothetical protein [Hymenobacter sediminis]